MFRKSSDGTHYRQSFFARNFRTSRKAAERMKHGRIERPRKAALLRRDGLIHSPVPRCDGAGRRGLLDAQPVAPRLVVAPLVGEEVAAFSVDELTYNETLGDWRTHDGIDIAAEVGTQVIAACSGVVTAVRDDDMMGTLVTIAHDDGYETTYANLRSSPGVGEGQYVSAGEVIGAVGSSSIAEFSMPAHLHFSVSKDGVPCDPKEFLN